MRKRALFNSTVRIWLRPLWCGFFVRLMSRVALLDRGESAANMIQSNKLPLPNSAWYSSHASASRNTRKRLAARAFTELQK